MSVQHAALSASFEGLRDMASREPYGSLAEQLQDALTGELDALEADYTKEVEDIAEALENMEISRDDVLYERDRAEDTIEDLKDKIVELKEQFNDAWSMHPGGQA